MTDLHTTGGLILKISSYTLCPIGLIKPPMLTRMLTVTEVKALYFALQLVSNSSTFKKAIETKDLPLAASRWVKCMETASQTQDELITKLERASAV